MSAAPVVLLKLGGSLITDKRRPEAPRLEVLARLAQELAAARAARPDLRLVIGHGSGSYGHVAGSRYGIRHGVSTPEGWYGFAATADAAARLNRIVTTALLAVGLPVWSIQPGVALRSAGGRLLAGPEETVALALERGLIPLVYGDVALDSLRGGSIASTEEIFERLADQLQPARVLLAGEVDGIFTADPQLDPAARPIAHLTPATLDQVAGGLGGSHGVDVTGGMAAKVQQALGLVRRHPGLAVVVCSGLIPGHLFTALTDWEQPVGTRITE